jgi:hypothetical protein
MLARPLPPQSPSNPSRRETLDVDENTNSVLRELSCGPCGTPQGIQNRMGALFFVLVYLALLSLSSLPLWREERALFLRERASGVYGTSAYFVTVVLFDLLPLRILPPCLLTVIAYPLVGFQVRTRPCPNDQGMNSRGVTRKNPELNAC